MGLSDLQEIIAGIKGADYADLYAARRVSHGVRYDDGRVEALSSSRGGGMGLRLIIGGNSVYAHTAGTKMSDAGSVMLRAADMSGLDLPRVGGDDEMPWGEALTIPAIDAGFLSGLDHMLRDECKYLRQAAFGFSTSRHEAIIVRGDGSVSRDEHIYTSFRVSLVLERDGAVETGYEARSLTCGADKFWTDGATPESVARAALARALTLLDARPCPAGVMTVLLDGPAGGAMIHEACGHGLEADIVKKDYSAFRDKIGERVANPIVTIIDDATLPGRWGSYSCDDEGTPAARNVLVEDGVLRMYMTDVLSAREGGLPLTGNGRRQSYSDLPMPRMSNTFVAPGETDSGEMLESMGSGLLVKKMGGGEVNPTSGDFVFQVTEGYLVEGGKITSAVKGATLAGNGPEALWNIAAVGKDLHLDPGTCGKSGQGVPVTDGQPSLLIKNLIVGGPETDNA
jgi:TldD protein